VRHRPLLTIGWFLGLLCLPAVAWLLGVRQPDVENRAKAAFPELNRSSLQAKETFAALDAAILDRLPGRDRAITLRNRIAVDLFRDSPNPDVAIGDDGWLYFVPGLQSCVPGTQPAADPADAAEIVARTLLASGRRTMVIEPADKLFTHARDAPEIDAARERCARHDQDAVEARLRASPGGVEIDSTLRRIEQDEGPTFLRSDSHWNWRGRLVFLRRLLNTARPGLADEAGLHVGGPIRQRGDLSALQGIPRDDDDRAVVVRRTPRHPLPAGDVVVVGDSQVERSLLASAGVGDGSASIRDVALPGQEYCSWPALQQSTCDDLIRKARTVIVESVGRNLLQFEQQCPRLVALSIEDMRGRPGSWERVDGGSQAPDAPLALPAGGDVRVRAVPADGDVRATPRLLLFPLRALPPAPAGQPPAKVTFVQQPQAGPPAPCAWTEQAVVGQSLALPVPAGRRASDLVVQLSGPPGTVVGRPEVVVLDGRRAARR